MDLSHQGPNRTTRVLVTALISFAGMKARPPWRGPGPEQILVAPFTRMPVAAAVAGRRRFTSGTILKPVRRIPSSQSAPPGYQPSKSRQDRHPSVALFR